MNKKQDLLYKLENTDLVFNISSKGFLAVDKYQPKYKFERDIGEVGGWNNETDAFRHAWEAAYTRYKYGNIVSKSGMWLHERNGNKYANQDPKEENMDKWNNQVGQEIGKEISERIKGMESLFNQQAIEDYIRKSNAENEGRRFNYQSE